MAQWRRGKGRTVPPIWRHARHAHQGGALAPTGAHRSMDEGSNADEDERINLTSFPIPTCIAGKSGRTANDKSCQINMRWNWKGWR